MLNLLLSDVGEAVRLFPVSENVARSQSGEEFDPVEESGEETSQNGAGIRIRSEIALVVVCSVGGVVGALPY